MTTAILTADDDAAQAVVKRWKANADLVAAVPGGIEWDRLTSFLPDADPKKTRHQPYAKMMVEAGPAATESPHSTGGAYIDCRLVTIEIRGPKAGVESARSIIRTQTIFNRQTLLTQQPLVGCRQLDDESAKKDEHTKDAEDVWVGTVRLHIWTDRPE